MWAVRSIHGLLTLFFLSCICYLYYAALSRRRSRLVYAAIGALVVEGAVVSANGGDCPLGPLHRRYGDDRDFFELFMPRRYSKRAVPILGSVAVAGAVLALLRSRPQRA